MARHRVSHSDTGGEGTFGVYANLSDVVRRLRCSKCGEKTARIASVKQVVIDKLGLAKRQFSCPTGPEISTQGCLLNS
jgi:hypothetical protein